MNEQKNIEWLTIYEVRDILELKGVIVPMGEDGYNCIVSNGFAFDENKFMWRELENNNSKE